MPIEFRILGPLELSVDDRVLPLGSPKQRALLALLLVHANETISRDQLIEELWAEAAPATVESGFHVYLSRLRRMLDTAAASGLLVREAHGYRLRVEPQQLDASRFDSLVGEGSEALAGGNAELAADFLRQALTLWRGPALADVQSERFAITASARLEEKRISAVEQRVEADLALGCHRQLIGELEPLVTEHPYRERLRAQLMLALYGCGRQTEALRAYQQARHVADELGLEPGRELKELEQAILRQDEALTFPPRVKSVTAPELAPPPAPVEIGSPREERKVVTVLFVDPGGSADEAGGLDPEEVRLVQERYWIPFRREIERHGGTVDRFADDAVIALFGAPQAHEDDPERAVRAALAIRSWACEEEGRHVRIGIATGEALVRVGLQPHGEGMAAGEVIITAPRLAAAAAPNGIHVGESVHQATKHAIDYREVEPVPANGKAFTVWEALQARSQLDADDVHEASTLVGRVREIELLLSTFARVREERAPQLVTLVGVPGIGKSRLVYELMRALEAKPELVTWRLGRSLSYGDGVSFSALAEIVKAEAGILESDTGDEASDKLSRVVHELLGVEVEAQWVEGELRPLAGLPDDGEPASDRRNEAFAAWRRFFEALAERHPLVLVFEDLHWADDGLLDFIDALVEWIGGVPLLVLATARPELLERRPQWAGGKANAATLSLSPLPDQETVRLLNALLERSVRPTETQALLSHTGGNPLYAVQYARMLSERGDADALPLPGTVHAIIAARLDALSVEEKSLLQNAAVVGRVFWGGALDSDPEAVRVALHSLERKEFVGRESHSAVAGEEQYVFRHVLLHDVAYGQIPRADRADLHLRAAEWLESFGRREDHAETIAQHYLSTLQYLRALGNDCSRIAAPARRALVEAGERASRLNAFEVAAGYYDQALALWPHDDAKRPLVSFAFAEALHRRGAEGQRERLQQAKEELLAIGDLERAAEAEAMLAEAAWFDGNDELCRQHLERALGLLHQRPASAARARVLATVARHRANPIAEWEAVVDLASEALTIAEALDLAEIRADARITLGKARVFLADAAGLEDIEQGLALAVATNSLIVAERGYEALWLAIAIEATSEFRRLPEVYEEAIRVAERLGNIHLLRSAQSAMIATQRFVGEWDDALQAADAFIAESERAGTHPHGVRLQRAYIRQARDDSAGALEDIEKSLEAQKAREASSRPHLRSVMAVFLLVELGRLEQARTLADEVVDRHPWLGLSEFALIAADVGYLSKVRAALDALSRRRPPDIAAEAIIEGRFVEAADVLAEMGRMAAAARVRLRAAETLVAEGCHGEASEQLDKALAFYRSVSATRYIRQAEALIAASNSAQEQQRA
ncbi:MAG: BTAD domain-containing putative transcriptional regulator [Solirubrobacteraceae bacterium]